MSYDEFIFVACYVISILCYSEEEEGNKENKTNSKISNLSIKHIHNILKCKIYLLCNIEIIQFVLFE